MPEYTVVKLLPLHYVHIRDVNKNIVKVVTGPKTFTCEEFEEVVLQPTKMISIPPDNYVLIENPVVRDGHGKVVEGPDGEDKLRYGDEEVRFHQDPFPLYYGEVCKVKVSPLPLVKENEALVLRARLDLEEIEGHPDGKPRKAGESWMFLGPGLYSHRVGVDVVQTVQAKVLKLNEALWVRATEDTYDWNGIPRKAGSEWLVKKFGAYLPAVHEEVVRTIEGRVIDHKTALHVRAKDTFYVDDNGQESYDPIEDDDEEEGKRKKREAGEEWLVSRKEAEVYFTGIHAEVLGEVKLTVMTESDYCIIENPYDEKTGKYRLGSSKLLLGPENFFLRPGETITALKKVRVLRANEGLWVVAKEEYVDQSGHKHPPGDEWIVKGPCAFVEPLEVNIKQQINAKLSIWLLGIHIFESSVLGLVVLGLALFAYYLC